MIGSVRIVQLEFAPVARCIRATRPASRGNAAASHRHHQGAAPRDKAESPELDRRDVPRADVCQRHFVGRDVAYLRGEPEDRVEAWSCNLRDDE